jgi:phosphoglycolate phosphatase
LKRKLTAIFDLDGTLIDSFGQISECAIRVRYQLRMKVKTQGDLEKLIGLPAELLFSDGSPEILEEAVIMFRNELLVEIERGNTVYPGAIEMLRDLKTLDIGTAVATSKPHHLALLVVKNSPLNGLVDFVQGLDGFPPKPNPEVVARCQAELPAERFVMFGDRPEDIIAGVGAGCFPVGIAQGFFEEKELKESGAHETYPSIERLSMDIEGLLTRLEVYGK